MKIKDLKKFPDASVGHRIFFAVLLIIICIALYMSLRDQIPRDWMKGLAIKAESIIEQKNSTYNLKRSGQEPKIEKETNK